VKTFTVTVRKVLSAGSSETIARLVDDETGEEHYSRGDGHNNVVDLLPGGALYLGSSWDEVLARVQERDDAMLPVHLRGRG